MQNSKVSQPPCMRCMYSGTVPQSCEFGISGPTSTEKLKKKMAEDEERWRQLAMIDTCFAWWWMTVQFPPGSTLVNFYRLRTLEPRTKKEIAFERKNLILRILLNWWRFGRMVNSSSSAKDSGSNESLILSTYCPDGATLPSRAAGPPYWIIVSEIA